MSSTKMSSYAVHCKVSHNRQVLHVLLFLKRGGWWSPILGIELKRPKLGGTSGVPLIMKRVMAKIPVKSNANIVQYRRI